MRRLTVGADVQQLAADAQAGKRQRRVAAGEEHQVHGGRHVVEKKGEQLQNGRGAQDVEIVQDENEGGGVSGELVDQSESYHIYALVTIPERI